MDDEQALFDDDGLPRRMLYRQYYVRTPQNELQCWVTISALGPPVPTSSLPLPADEVATAWSPWSPSVEDEPLTVATVKRKEPSNESTCSCDGCATKEGKYCYLNCHLSS